MSSSNEPMEITTYKRRVLVKSWILTVIALVICAVLMRINWVFGVFLGQCLGVLNFSMLCKQTSKLAQTSSDKAKGVMVFGHWMRYLILGIVVYFVYQKQSISFAGFLIGLIFVYLAIFWDGVFGLKKDSE